MAKQVLQIKAECFAANRNKQGSNIVIAANIEQSEKGPASRTAVNIVLPDNDAAARFSPGKAYTVTITED
jgi:phage tail protein X